MAITAHRRRGIAELVQKQGVVRIADLVEQFGISRWTAHRDLEALSSEGLLFRSRGGAVALPPPTTDPNQRPVVPPIDASDLHIGLVLPTQGYYYGRVPGYYYGQVTQAVQSYFNAAHARVSIATPATSAGADSETVDQVLEAGADSLLLTPRMPRHPTQSLAWIEELNRPTVLIEREPPGDERLSAWSVSTDHPHGLGQALRHLRELGHRRICFTALNDYPHTRRLQRFWMQELMQQGLDHDVPFINGDSIADWPVASEADLDTVFAQLREAAVTAVISHNDLAAKVIAQHAAARGWSVPGDLSIVAYSDELASGPPLPLTAVSPAKSTIGRVAAQSLVELVRDATGPPRRIRIEPVLVVRESTGPPRGA